jgi:hypothetical protein
MMDRSCRSNYAHTTVGEQAADRQQTWMFREKSKQVASELPQHCPLNE